MANLQISLVVDTPSSGVVDANVVVQIAFTPREIAENLNYYVSAFVFITSDPNGAVLVLPTGSNGVELIKDPNDGFPLGAVMSGSVTLQPNGVQVVTHRFRISNSDTEWPLGTSLSAIGSAVPEIVAGYARSGPQVVA